jgi:hypothetical protein
LISILQFNIYRYIHSLILATEEVWFKCDLYLQFIPHTNLFMKCVDLRLFAIYLVEPFLIILREKEVEIGDFGIEKNNLTWSLNKKIKFLFPKLNHFISPNMAF